MNRVLEFMGKDHDRLDKLYKEFKNLRPDSKDNAKSKKLLFTF